MPLTKLHVVPILLVILNSCQVYSRHFHGKNSLLHEDKRNFLVQIHPKPQKERGLIGSKKSVNVISQESPQTMQDAYKVNDAAQTLEKIPSGERPAVVDFMTALDKNNGYITPGIFKKIQQLETINPALLQTQNRVSDQSHLNGVSSDDLTLPLSLSYADDFERNGKDKNMFLPGDLDGQSQNDYYQGNPMPEYNYKDSRYSSRDENSADGYYKQKESKEATKEPNPLRGSFADETAHNNSLLDVSEQAEKSKDQDSGEDKHQTSTMENEKFDLLTNGKEKTKKEESLNLSKELLDKIDTETLESVLSQRKEQEKESTPLTGNTLQEKFKDEVLNENFKLLVAPNKEEMQKGNTNLKNQENDIRPTLKSIASLKNTKPKVNQVKQIKLEKVLNKDFVDSNLGEQEKIVGLVNSNTLPSEPEKIDWKKANKQNFISLRIIGDGKPVSFKTDSSKDGSILLSLPSYVKIVEDRENENNSMTEEIKSIEPESSSVEHLPSHPSVLGNNYYRSVARASANTVNKNNNNVNEISRNDEDQALSILAQQILSNPNKWKVLGKTASDVVREQDKNEKGITHNNIENGDTRNTQNNFRNILFSSKLSKALDIIAKTKNLRSGSQSSDSKGAAKTENENKTSQFVSGAAGSKKELQSNENPESLQQLLRTLVREIQSQRQTKQDFTEGSLPTSRTRLFSSFKNVPSPVSTGIVAKPVSYLKEITSFKHQNAVSPVSAELTKKESDFEERELKMFDKDFEDQKSFSSDYVWNPWSPCSTTCGTGIRARARLCSDDNCLGYRTESKSCFLGYCSAELSKAGLIAHNKFRAWHGSPPLIWSKELTEKAKEIATALTNKETTTLLSDLSGFEVTGENIAKIWHGFETAPLKATELWYGEVKEYNFQNPEITDVTKHFTQMVWKSSKRFGMAAERTREGQYTIVVALYDPPGNSKGELIENVLIPKSINDARVLEDKDMDIMNPDSK